MTASKTDHFMQCACGMAGNGVEVGDTGTFRNRTFHVTSKDHPETVHRVTFRWSEEDRHSTGECFGQV